jgi:hypothetical protein
MANMGGEEGLPSQFGISLQELREIMEYRGIEAQDKVAELGGTHEICRKLASSPINGKKNVIENHIIFISDSENSLTIPVRLIVLSEQVIVAR